MACPLTHEWYELERGTASREDAVRLRRHLAECADCAAHCAEDRTIAAALERLTDATRVDMAPDVAEALYRRAHGQGLLGRGHRRPLVIRVAKSRWVRAGLTVGVAAAAAVVIAIGIRNYTRASSPPRGSLNQLANYRPSLSRLDSLRALGPVARAAVSEELARVEPSTDQVADLLLVAYIAEHPKEDRQIKDVHFLLDAVWARRHPAGAVAAAPVAWPMLASTALAQPGPASPRAADYDVTSPLAAAKAHMLAGHYNAALAALPTDGSAAVLRGWCMASAGQAFDAKGVLYEASERPDGATARVLRADLELASNNIAEAMKQYETLAVDRDRYWFTAGYLCRYELRDARATGERMAKVRDAQFAGYVAREFMPELAAAKAPEPEKLIEEDFESLALGDPPADWPILRMRGGEFHVVGVSGGRAIEQNEMNYRGAEFLTGDEGWTDYTLKVDVKVLEAQEDFAISAVACRQAGHKGYMLEWSPPRLRIMKEFTSNRPGTGAPERWLLEPEQGQVRLEEPLASGWWYTMKLRVQRVDGGVSVAGKVWRSDTPEPMDWQVVWTDTGQKGDGPFEGGAVGLQISGAKAQIDNFSVTRNAAAPGFGPARRR